MNKKELYPKISNFRELMESSVSRFKNNIAYKYRKPLLEGSNCRSDEVIEKTYWDVGNDVKAFATALLERGYAGKRIAIIGTNRYEWVISYFSIESAGIVAAPMDKLLPSVEVESLVQRSDVNAIIFEKCNLEMIKNIKGKSNNNLEMLICMDTVEDDEVINFEDLLKEGYELVQANNNKYESAKINDNEMSIMLFTSGTTDKSKIVMLSQENILSNVRAYTTHIKIYPTDTLLSVLPIHHTFECSITITYGFFCGATVAFSDGIKYIPDNLKEYKVTVLVAVPLLIENFYKKITRKIEEQGKTKSVENAMKMANRLLKMHIDIRKLVFKQILSGLGGHLRLIFYGAAPADKDTVQYMANLGIKMLQGYGLTETSPALCGETDTLQCIGTAGIPLNNVRVKINNPNEDGIGDIVVKGPNVFLGYYGDKAKTDEVFIDGWFNTGDLGYINNSGCLVITGRRNDIIVLGNGKNIYPEELEQLINRLPYVKESLVFPRGNSKTDTLLVAKIVYDAAEMKNRYPDAKVDDYEAIIWRDIDEINKNLPLFKNIKKIIVTGKELTKTTTQKVKRFQEIDKIESKKPKVEAANETEKKIIECFKNILCEPDIDAETNFFEIGGDSLSAIDLQMELAKISIDLNTQEIYDNPSARKMYQYITSSEESAKTLKLVQVNIESESVEIKPQNNVLLTGATGFLGVHILNDLIKSTYNNVYCIVRSSADATAEDRLRAKYKFYFANEDFDGILNTRLFVVDGDITKEFLGTDEATYKDLLHKIDIIINSAASVTHYGSREHSYKCNVLSVDNILKFTKESGALLNHISTTGLAGNNLVNTNDCLKDTFSENDLIIGQRYDQNVYLSTKLEAEEHVIEQIKAKAIHANIMRAGNLMNRYSDNIFQENKDTNAFQNKMREIIKIGVVPREIVNFSFDLTPVDMCAEAIVKLALHNQYNNVYHVLNSHELEFDEIAQMMKSLNIDVQFMDLQEILNSKTISKWLINDFLLNNKKKIKIESEKTTKMLEALGFSWNIENEYYIKVFKSIIYMN